MRKIFVLTGFFVVLAAAASGQNMSSPYSVYGVGEIQAQHPDRSSGMANTSVSLLSTPGFILNKNPASIIGLERSLAQIDLGIVGKIVSFKGNVINGDNSSTRDVTIKRISLSAKLNNHWASSIGLMPFSYVNYSFNAPKTVEGAPTTYTGLYEGNGGLKHIFWTNGFALGKNLALGVRSSFIFGSINQIETLAGGGLNSSVVTQLTDYYSGFRFEGGAIYGAKLSKDWRVSLGGKVTTKSDLTSNKTITVTEGGSVVEQDKQLSDGTFTLPWQYDAGISFVNKGRTTFTVDYSYGDWNKLNPGGGTWTMVNNERISAGVQFSKQVQRFGMVAEKSYLSAGLFSDKSYLQVKGQHIEGYGATIGYGGYLSRGLAYNLAVEAGRRGTLTNNLIRENYFQFTLSLSYREVLYSKGRKYD
ncbi:hypothetical protein [Longitalea luteola]|uniref:hypothetical protein n=1 Tax=Longitalea luteola TaxID=2812563 RepID=UPI001A9618B9|nr:hypothetical protein [Longitalea luteola]